MEALEETLFCKKCEESLPILQFCKDSGYLSGRRSDCNSCRNLVRRKAPPAQTITSALPRLVGAPVQMPYFTTVAEKDLPDPTRVPAHMLKRYSDYWLELVGGNEPTTRII